VQNIEHIQSNIDKFYLNNIDPRAKCDNYTNNPFDYVFNQKYDESYENIEAVHLGNYSKFNPIENSDKILNFKKIVSKLELKDSLKNYFDKYQNQINFDEETLGVHIRLCDMNIVHGLDYGIVTYQEYENCIERFVDKTNKIFVCSDNNESINKLIKKYGKKINYVPNMIRADTEVENTMQLQINYLNTETFWIESFLDMLLLSKCSSIICRTSNLANASIIFSNSIKNVIRL
jgi:hypothetical protein